MRTLILLSVCLSITVSAFSQNLVAYYPFNGNNNDESGNNINPTYTGAGVTLTTDRFGYNNKAYFFDGTPGPNYSISGSYMRMPADNLPTGNRTVSLWFFTNDVNNRPGFLGYGGNGSCGTTYLMGINLSGAGQFHVQGHCGNNTAAYTYVSAPINNWYQWVLTINGSTQKIYVNGILKSTDNTFSGSTATTGVDFALGAITHTNGLSPYTDANVGFFQGKLDDVRIYDDAMSDAQVFQLYKTELSGMAAYYPFNGNANDESGNGINPVYNGATLTTDRFGNTNSAYYFNGTNTSYIKLPADNFPATNRTISFWLNADEVATGPTLFSYGGDGSCGASTFLMGLNVTGLGGYVCEGHCDVNRSVYTYSTAPVNNWKHWVVTVNGSTIKMYLNGVLVQTDNVYSGATYVNGRFAVLGGLIYITGLDPYGYYYKGKLDDVRIYDDAITDAQVLQLYKNESTGMAAYYPFNGNANDESGNGNNGTVNGATLTTDRFGIANKAYNFTNPNHISIPNSNIFGDEFTLSYWFKINSYFGQRGVMSNVEVPNGGFQQYFDGTSFAYILGYSFIGGYNPNYFFANHTMQEPVNQWHHLVLTYKKLGTYASETKLYINGYLKRSDVHSMPITFTPNATFYIGQNHGGVNFQGDLDDIRIYNRILSPNEILQLADIPMQPELQAYYPMNGNADDMSGNNRNGTPYGGTVLTTDKYGNNNAAYSFDGIASGITLANTASLDFIGSEFTLSSWVKYSNIIANSMVVGKHDCGTPNGYILSIENNNVSFWLSNGSSWNSLHTIETYNDGKWHHITGSFDGVVMYLYVDGILKSSSPAVYNNPASGTSIKIGDPTGSCGSGIFNGSIDEVKIYGNSLDAAQAMALYRQGRGSGHALSFNGAGNYVDCGDPADNSFELTGDATIEAWVKANVIPPTGGLLNNFTIVSKSAGAGNNYWVFGLQDGRTMFSYGNSGVHVYSGLFDLDLSKYYHVALVKSGSNVSFYINGKLSQTVSGINSVPDVPGPLTIGYGNTFFNCNMNGNIDELRFWGTALSETQLQDWMNRKITPDHPQYSSLKAYYNFDEPTQFKTYDSKHAITGQYINGPAIVISGAGIGDASAHDFINATKSAILTLPTGENFRATASNGNPEGISVYMVKDPPVTITGTLGVGSNEHYYGVHLSAGSNPQYTAVYDYTGDTLVTQIIEAGLLLFSRTDNSYSNWNNSGAILNVSNNTLTVSGQNTEYILGSSGFPLPVTLLDLKAQKINATTAALNWQTKTEINNRGFEVQRSFDGSNFSIVKFVNGAGNTTNTIDYSITDVPGRNGRVYYRLNQVDMDGRNTLSNTVSLLFVKETVIKIYPNPAQQQVIAEGITEFSRVQVVDGTGRLLKDIVNNGQYQVTIKLGGLLNGFYFIRLVSEKETKTIKLAISN